MKKIKVVYAVLILCLTNLAPHIARAQTAEVTQLLLNVEKLSQLQGILSDMKKGYTVLVNGYNAVKNIAEGNFSLHATFLDGLMLVNPEIKKYHRVADIIRYQQQIVKEYRAAYNRFRSSGNFRAEELEYLGRVYGQLFNQSVDNLDALLMVITASKLRMGDDERLAAIDRIFADTESKLTFLRHFNAEAGLLDMLRGKEKDQLGTLRNIYLPNK